MASTNINIRTDSKVKKKAEAIFNGLGLNMSTAINIFLRQTIRENGMPFPLKLDIPNETTIAAINETEKLINDKNTPRYKSIEELKKALDEL